MIESGVLALVCLAPWAFGATAPRYEFLMDLGAAGLAALWAVRVLLGRRPARPRCPVAACLAVLVVVAAWQLVPLPKGPLRRVSPATARMYDRLLPARPEVLPADDPGGALAPPAGSTLTVDRGATRREVARLLAVLLLFAVVRGNVDPAGGLRRLALAALVNGSLLALFGLVQASSSAPQTIYWSYPTVGGPFGPFINRNHFAFYVNVCVGLGVGLLLGRGRTAGGRGVPSWTRLASGLLRDPSAIGITFAIGLMISGVAVSLSRGGFLALLGGSLLGLALWAPRLRGRSIAGWGVLLAPAVALALVCWLGFDRIADRLATLGNGEVLEEQRPAIWARALPVARDFPLWGTGSGTYEFADMLHRAGAGDAEMVVDHAHNDYLELLVEGGLAQFLPGVLALALVFRLGFRAARQWGGTPTGGLATGALMGLAAVAIHSVTDFGLHIPSCAALVAVLAALVSGLGGGEGPRPETAGAARPSSVLRGAAAVLVAGSALASGLFVAHEGWRAYRAREIQDRASDLDRSGDPTRLERKVALLEEAARVAPEDYLIREGLVSAHLSAFDQQLYELTEGEAAAAASPGPAPPRRRPPDPELGRLKAAHLVPALRHLRRSRDLCPLRALVHLELAEHAGDFEAAEPRQAYLERAKLLAPADPDLWYRCGLFELEAGEPDRAWASWRHSLEVSGEFLPEILGRAAGHLGPREILGRVLPDDPDRLLAAATHLSPGSVEVRRPFLERALTLLDRRPDPSADDRHLRATMYRSLGRADEALEAYRSALAREPLRLDWRLELAELSSESGRLPEARQELLTILGLRPGDTRARALLDEVTRKIAEGK